MTKEFLTDSGFVARLCVFYGALFIYSGIHLPFFPLWLGAKGLGPDTIGLILAIHMLVRVVAIPFAAREVDRRDALRAGLFIAACAATLAYIAVAFAEGPAALIATYTVAALFFSLLMPFADAYALRGLKHFGRAYGPVRVWGSAAFVVGSFGAGLLLETIAARDLIWVIIAALAATAAAALVLKPLPREPHGYAGERPQARILLRNPFFLCLVLAASFVQASHAFFYGFSALSWGAKGLDGSTIGLLWTLGVVAEIVLFALSGRLPAAIGPTQLLIIGAIGGVIRWAGMAFDPPAPVLMGLQVLHALSFGATYLGAAGAVAQVAPPGLAATGQGSLSLSVGALTAAATMICGPLYAAYGDRAYLAMALMSLAGTCCALALPRLRGAPAPL